MTMIQTEVKTLENSFTDAEREVITKCMNSDQMDTIPIALQGISTFEMTPEKEKVLQEFLDKERPVEIDDESDVRRELMEKEIKENYRIETPEQEAEWQAKFDAERAAKKAKLQSAAAVATEALGQVNDGKKPAATTVGVTAEIPADDLSELDLTRPEIMAELEKLGIKYKTTDSKSSLVDALEAAQKNKVSPSV